MVITSVRFILVIITDYFQVTAPKKVLKEVPDTFEENIDLRVQRLAVMRDKSIVSRFLSVFRMFGVGPFSGCLVSASLCPFSGCLVSAGFLIFARNALMLSLYRK